MRIVVTLKRLDTGLLPSREGEVGVQLGSRRGIVAVETPVPLVMPFMQNVVQQ
jgi:hypothetical protein